MKKFLLLLVCGLTSAGHAQNYTIPWHKIAGGGGAGAGGNYALDGTIGQPDASLAASGGPYSLTGGFWVTTALQTAGAPTLSVAGSGNSVTLYWPGPAGWTLQQTSDLSNPAGWIDSSSYSTVNGTNYLILANPSGNLFFRLRH